MLWNCRRLCYHEVWNHCYRVQWPYSNNAISTSLILKLHWFYFLHEEPNLAIYSINSLTGFKGRFCRLIIKSTYIIWTPNGTIEKCNILTVWYLPPTNDVNLKRMLAYNCHVFFYKMLRVRRNIFRKWKVRLAVVQVFYFIF